MIPTLYPENTTQFISNGIGRLTDAISCTIKQNKEGAYELTMEYPLDGIHAAEITNNRIIYAKPERGKGEQPFRIRNIEKNLNGRMKITARHTVYDLNYYVCSQFGQVETLPYKVKPSLYNVAKQLVGTLEDAITQTVTTVDSKWKLLMQYPVNGVLADRIVEGAYIYFQPEIGREQVYFEIKTLQFITVNTITVTAEANIVPFSPTEYNMMTVDQALGYINTYTAQIQACPFSLMSQPTTAGDAWSTTTREFWSDIPKTVKSLIQGSEGSVVNTFGGEWEFDHWQCVLHENRGSDNGVQYRYGKNITSISERINIDEIYTHAFAFWKGTASSSTDTERGEYYVMSNTPLPILDSAYTVMFPLQRTLVIDASGEFESKPTAAELDAYTRKYVQEHSSGTPQVTISVSIVDLANTKEYEDIANLEQVNMYDTVTIVFPQFGINVKSKITEIEFDVLREKNNKVTIGDVTTNLANIISNNKKDIVKAKYELRRWADNAMERATEALAGWYGGNIRKNYNKNDHKQQSMFIMDTDNKDTAEKVMAFDGNGIGISNNGASGDYKYMVSMSGNKMEFNDDFAEDGNTNASFLKRGTIRSSIKNYWNLETDKASFELETLEVVGDAKVNGKLYIGTTDVGAVLNELESIAGDIDNITSTLEEYGRRISALERKS